MTLRGQQAEGAHEVEIEIRASAARVLEVLSVPQSWPAWPGLRAQWATCTRPTHALATLI
jgi:hypothetical protein